MTSPPRKPAIPEKKATRPVSFRVPNDSTSGVTMRNSGDRKTFSPAKKSSMARKPRFPHEYRNPPAISASSVSLRRAAMVTGNRTRSSVPIATP